MKRIVLKYISGVRDQKEDLPHDSKDPLYKFGFGLTY